MEEQERRAASALLAVMGAVPAFGRAVLADFRAPTGRLRTYVEVPLKLKSGTACRPDGAVQIERGNRTWGCLVEVKTSNAVVQADQVGLYLDSAREFGFSSVLTISNEITPTPADLPFSVDRRRVGKLVVRHVSWWQIVTAAIVQYRHKGVSDPDQAWILGELIAYLTHPNSGATGFRDMGPGWVAVRDAARQGTLRSSDPEAAAVISRWEQFVRYVCLSLSQDLGRPVQPIRGTKKEDPKRSIKDLAETGRLVTALRVPDAAGPIGIQVDVRTQTVEVSVDVAAPDDRGSAARISWLLRQLKGSPDGLRLDVAFAGLKVTTSELLGRAREDSKSLLLPNDPKREPRSFRVTVVRPMALRRGRDGDSFIRETLRQVLDFYEQVVQELRPWRPPPPQVKERDRILEAATAELTSDAFPVRAESPILSSFAGAEPSAEVTTQD